MLSNKKQIIQSENQIVAFENLNYVEKNAVIALILSKSIREASRKYKAMTGRSVSDFWANAYPRIKDNWKIYSNQINDMAIMRLRAGALDAVDELLVEIKDANIEIRHKASKYVLDRVLLDGKNDNSIEIKRFQKTQFNFDKYFED
jgi:hypothetical protein